MSNAAWALLLWGVPIAIFVVVFGIARELEAEWADEFFDGAGELKGEIILVAAWPLGLAVVLLMLPPLALYYGGKWIAATLEATPLPIAPAPPEEKRTAPPTCETCGQPLPDKTGVHR